jgi:5-methylcytosine-specific restriction endonuclease McrA
MLRPEAKRELRAKLWETQRGCCFWCGLYMTLRRRPDGNPGPKFATFDHVDERRNGGTWDENNLVLAHRACNHKRSKI